MCQWQSFLYHALANSQFFAIIMHQSVAPPWGICPNAHSNLIKSPLGILTNPLPPGCKNRDPLTYEFYTQKPAVYFA